MTENQIEESPSDAFEAMASEFAIQIRKGQTPSIDEFANRNQELASRVLRLFPVLELMERNGEYSDQWSEAELLHAEKRHQKLNGDRWAAPKRLGDFRLIREIGRGGMGIVFEAQQESLGRRVAIKILPSSAQFDERRTERFATEAKASAMLHHTNIVPVFGVGREDGLSFFVMQYINGQPLNAVLRDVARIRDLSTKPFDQEDTSTLSTEHIVRSMFGNETQLPKPDQSFTSDSPHSSRPESSGSEPVALLQSDSSDPKGIKSRIYFRNVARIGLKVAEALDHAHCHGILHRDIKPSNLLLDDEGAVWVTDFGLAKYFDSPDITRTGEVVGTLRYMSPEQLFGKATPRSDIFGLGLTLYEMLTLQPAYLGIDKKRLLEKVANANPDSLRAIDSRIPRDLETIVAKCIHPEPSKRYQSAAAVSDDLERFLNGQPIRARRITPLEKSWKWCCRRPALAVAVTLLTASVVLGTAGVAWQWNKTHEALVESEANFEKAEEHFSLARSAVVQIAESISNEELLTSPDLLPLRRKLLLKALDYQIKFVEDRAGNVDVETELAEAYLQLAAVAHELNQASEAKHSLEESKTILERLLRRDLRDPERERAIVCLAENYSLLGEIEMLDSPDGQFYMFKAVEILLDGRNESNLTNTELLKLADLYHRLGDADNGQNLARARPLRSVTESALEHYTKAFEIVNHVARGDKLNDEFKKTLGDSHRDLGSVNRRLRNFDLAFTHYSAAVETFRELVAKEPDNTEFQFGLAEALSSLAFYHSFSKRDPDLGLRIYHESIEGYQNLAKAYPSVRKFADGEIRATQNCCLIYEGEKRSKDALLMRERTLKLSEKALLFSPNDARLLSAYGKALMGMGINFKRRRKYQEALEYLEQARVQHISAIKNAPDNPAYRIRLGRTIHNIGYTHEALRDFPTAYRKTLEAVEGNYPEPEVMYLTGRAMLHLARKVYADADALDVSDLEIADLAIESAKQIFEKIAGPKLGTRERILSDRKLKRFLSSEIGVSFMEWFDSINQENTSAKK